MTSNKSVTLTMRPDDAVTLLRVVEMAASAAATSNLEEPNVETARRYHCLDRIRRRLGEQCSPEA